MEDACNHIYPPCGHILRINPDKACCCAKSEHPPTHPHHFKTNPPNKITPSYVRSQPDTLFVFGDNDQRRGTGGQAKIRNEPNTIGFRTKKAPRTNASAYYTDSEYKENISKMKEDLEEISRRSADYDSVYFIPGIGEGRAKLKEKAPKTYAWMKENLPQPNPWFPWTRPTPQPSRTKPFRLRSCRTPTHPVARRFQRGNSLHPHHLQQRIPPPQGSHPHQTRTHDCGR